MGYAFGILEVSLFEADLCYKITHIPAQLAAFACIIAAFSSLDFSSKTRAGLLMCIFTQGKKKLTNVLKSEQAGAVAHVQQFTFVSMDGRKQQLKMDPHCTRIVPF